MKTLVLIRHAKSSWKDAALNDHDRPLNKRGQSDAPAMAKLLADKITPDKVYSSTAVRARKTALSFAEEWKIKKKKIEFTGSIYEASVTRLMELIQSFDEEWSIVAMFGHNPAFTDLVNQLGNAAIDNMPTCSVAIIDFEEAHWAKLPASKGRLRHFLYPKMNAE
jgi:phosphohistidine phosphatase